MNASQFLDKLKTLSKEDLLEIKGLGGVLADNFLEFLESSRYKNLSTKFLELEKSGNNMDISLTQTNQANLPLSGKIICITGSFEIPRNEIKELLETRGAQVSSSISKNTNYLVAGEKAGSKLQKAETLGVKVISNYQELLN